MTLAYKYVALTLMLAEVNFFAGKADLKLDHPVGEKEVLTGSHIGPPKTNDFSGSVIAQDYFFGFGRGHLANFQRNDFRSDSDRAVRERNIKLSKQTSLIDTNGAYALAVNWLNAVGIDLAAVEKKYRLNIIQWKYYPERFGQGGVMLPVYQIEWRGSPFESARRHADMAVVSLTVLGTTKELVELHVLDDKLFSRPRIKIFDQDKLLSLSDAQFQAFDSAQRSNLVMRCTEQPASNNVLDAAGAQK